MGQCHDSGLRDGGGDASDNTFIKKKRSCTDVPCCILFSLFVAGFFLVTLWSFAMGDYRRVVHPTDSRGQVCGRDVPDKPYLYFFDLAKCFTFAPAVLMLGCPTPQVCVKQCPDYFWSWKSATSTRDLMICLGGKNAMDPEYKDLSIEELVRSHKCAPYTFNSKPVFGRCLPSQLSVLKSNASQLAYTSSGKEVVLADDMNKTITASSVIRGRNIILQLTGIFEKVAEDLKSSWPTIVLCLLLAILLSFLWIVIFRCCAGVMVWSSLILFVLLFSACAGFSFYRYHQLRGAEEEMPDELALDLTLYLRSPTLWLIAGILSTILLVTISLILIFLRSRILIAIRVINEAGKALMHMSSLLFWPLFPLVLELLLICQVLFVAICLRSLSDPIGTESVVTTTANDAKKDLQGFFQLIPCDPTATSSAGKACQFLYYGNKKYAIFLQFFNLFMFFWITNFIRALTETTLAGAFAQYYYSQQDPSLMSKCPILPSLRRTVVYHTGSLAFGSLLLAIFQWIRVIFEYFEAKFKTHDNACLRVLKRCCCCCLWCLEKFVRFLNRNAFIMIAVHGDNFCSSALKAFNLVIRNVIRVFVVDKITVFLLFIGKLVIVIICGACAYVYLDGLLFANTVLADYRPVLHYLGVPVAIIVLGSFLIASLFFSVFDMGVDTIFLCFLEDLEQHDGSSERPYQICTRLLDIVGKTNKPTPEKPTQMELTE